MHDSIITLLSRKASIEAQIEHLSRKIKELETEYQYTVIPRLDALSREDEHSFVYNEDVLYSIYANGR